MTRLTERIATNVKAAREDAGLSQEGLARLARVSARTISRIEQGDTSKPRDPEFARIAHALGTTPENLMGMVDDAPDPDPAEETDEQLDAEIIELTSDTDLVLKFMGRVRDPKKLPRALKLTIRDDLKGLRARHRQQG